MAPDITQYERLRNTKLTHGGMALNYAVRNNAPVKRTGLIFARKRAKLRQDDVAERMGVSAAQISRWENGHDGIPSQRLAALVTAYEADLEELFEGQVPQQSNVGQEIPIARTALIENLGKVAQGVWLEQSFYDPDERQFVSYDMRAGDPGPADLFAVTPEGQSMNRRFSPGMQLICRRIPFGDGVFKSGDYVVVERCAHDLRELTCKRVEIDDDGNFWLHSESDQPQFQEPWLLGRPDDEAHIDTEIHVIGKVIRGVVDYE